MSFHTLFHTISLMDHFIGKSPERLEISDLHLIGITCIYISSKYEPPKQLDCLDLDLYDYLSRKNLIKFHETNCLLMSEEEKQKLTMNLIPEQILKQEPNVITNWINDNYDK